MKPDILPPMREEEIWVLREALSEIADICIDLVCDDHAFKEIFDKTVKVLKETQR